MKSRRLKTITIGILVIISLLGIGYAFLQTDLTIVGTTGVKSATWDIHFENVREDEDSVTATTPATITNPTTVSYSAQLDEPGDFYEFSVDVVNDGSLDGMISSISSKLNGVEITEIPEYLDYSILYSDGLEIEENDLLPAGLMNTYVVHVGYKKDITASQLPENDQDLNFSFTVTYIQSDATAIDRGNSFIFAYSDLNFAPGYEFLEEDTENLYDSAEEAIAQQVSLHWQYSKYCFKFKVIDNVVREVYIIFSVEESYLLINPTMKPGMYEIGVNIDETLSNHPIYDKNKRIMLSAFGEDNCNVKQDSPDNFGISRYVLLTESHGAYAPCLGLDINYLGYYFIIDDIWQCEYSTANGALCQMVD